MISQQQRQKQIDRFHRALGEYVAGTVRVEAQLKEVAVGFFGMARTPRAEFFEAWVLDKLSLAQKIELVENILFFAIHDDRERDELKTDLRRMQQTRNDLVHSMYMQVRVGGFEEGEIHRLGHSKDRELGIMPRLDLERLEAEIAALPQLIDRLNHLWSPIRIRPAGASLPIAYEPAAFAARAAVYKEQRRSAATKPKNRTGNRKPKKS